MEYAAAIAIFLTLIYFGWTRIAAKNDDPLEQNRKAHDEISKDLASRNSMRNSEHLASELDELERLRDASHPK